MPTCKIRILASITLFLSACSSLCLFAGGRIAYQSNETGNYEIYVVNDDGSGKQQLTTIPGRSQNAPKFSPDGTEVAYLSCDSVGCALRIVSVEGSNDRLVKNFGVGMYLYDWSATDWIWVAVDTASGCWREEIRRIRPDGSGEETVVTELSHGAAEHPDGDKILYVRSRPCWTPDNEIRVKEIGTAGSGDIVLARDGQAEFWPSFAHTSDSFLFHQSDASSGHSSLTNIYLMNESWTSASRITNATGPQHYLTPVFSPDDQKVAAMYSPDGTDFDIVIIDLATGSKLCLIGGDANCFVTVGGRQSQPDWAPASPVYECVGFQPPLSSGPVSVRRHRALPFKAELFDEQGLLISNFELLASPVLQVLYTPAGSMEPIDVTEEALPAGAGTDGNQFIFSDGLWRFNLRTDNYSAAGTYTITMVSGDTSEYEVEGCTAQFIKQ